jgi:hypothetical protein
MKAKDDTLITTCDLQESFSCLCMSGNREAKVGENVEGSQETVTEAEDTPQI